MVFVDGGDIKHFAFSSHFSMILGESRRKRSNLLNRLFQGFLKLRDVSESSTEPSLSECNITRLVIVKNCKIIAHV